MQDHIFSGREKAIEEAYFHDQDARLLAKLRNRASLDEIAVALSDVLKVDDPELIGRIRGLGVTLDTAPAFFFAPLVQVAWAEKKVPKAAYDEVLRQARLRGVEENSAAYAQLEEWLHVSPSVEFFATGIEVLKIGFAVLPAAEREARIEAIIEACRKVAAAATGIEGYVGLRIGVTTPETSVVHEIANALHSRG